LASWREAGLLFLVGPFETLLSIYNAIVQPHFDYCSVVWGNCNKSLSIKLQKLQNRFAHILTSSYDANADNLFVTLGWQKHNLQRELKTATMVYKSLNGLAPDYLKSMFTDRSAISTYFCGISRSGWFNKHLGLYLSFSPLYCSFVRTFVLINLIALIVDLKLQHSLHFIITSVNALATYVRPQT